MVDAPVLVDVEHGSVRYRQPKTDFESQKSLKGKECPYENEEGRQLEHKDHYFYHTRLSKYGPGKTKKKNACVYRVLENCMNKNIWNLIIIIAYIETIRCRIGIVNNLNVSEEVIVKLQSSVKWDEN